MSNEVVQHVDIEVMKAEMATIREAVQSVGAKMDVVLQMQITLTQLQERQEQGRMALDRAFNAISDVKQHSATVGGDLSRVLAFVKGGAVVGALLVGFAQWYTLQQISILQENSKAVAAVDRRVMFLETKAWPESGGKPNDR